MVPDFISGHWKGVAPRKSSGTRWPFANDLADHRSPGVRFVGAKDDGNPIEKRRHGDKTFDIHPLPSCPLEELNRAAFESESLHPGVCRRWSGSQRTNWSGAEFDAILRRRDAADPISRSAEPAPEPDSSAEM